MKTYNRNGKLYIRINGIRKSTGLDYTKANINLVESHYKNDEFFNKFNVATSKKNIVEYCEDVFDLKSERLKSTSLKNYRSALDSKIIPFFKKQLFQDIRPIDIVNFYNIFTNRSAINTAVSGILRDAFQRAIVDEVIKENYCDMISFPHFEDTGYEINPFNVEEINLLLENSESWFKNFIGIALFTGMRTGEILALEWKDIDFNDMSINIKNTKSLGSLHSAKTKSSKRIIDIIEQAEYFLKEQKKITGLSTYIFCKTDGSLYFGSNSLEYHWKKLLKKCNLEERGIYQTRHTFASNMLSNKEELIWVSSMLGHKSMEITAEKYTKYIRTSRTRKRTFLDDVSLSFSTKMAH